jgi:exodeoxyribonuclease V alpha subunit
MLTWPAPDSLPDLSDHQRQQYAMAARGSLGLIGGRPGSGKTFLMARLVKALPQGRLAVCGPTGKSAVRVTETLQRAGVEGVRATTVHSLLKPSRDEDSGQWSFEHNEENPLDLDWILLDEGSMECCQMLGHLLAARPPGCKLVICGDVNQLPPVGFGAPLRDLITAGLPYGELVQIRRNAGRIVRCCHTIIDKHRFEPSPALDLAAESPENLLHVERRDPAEQIETIKAMLERFRGGMELPGRRRIDPVWQVQIIVPVNEKSPLARTRLNTILQSFLNPGGEQAKESKFRVGDKICCGRNHFAITEVGCKRAKVSGV